jgi:predicted ArsR family transcriptional regulator
MRILHRITLLYHLCNQSLDQLEETLKKEVLKTIFEWRGEQNLNDTSVQYGQYNMCLCFRIKILLCLSSLSNMIFRT